MLQPASLQVPKTGGRSRFSKALPAIPGIDTEDVLSPTPTLSSSTSTTPASAALTSADLKYLEGLPPPPPPPHDDCKKTPIQFTPLPPLPKTPKVTATPVAPRPVPEVKPPAMAIVRKPVGSSKPKVVVKQEHEQTQPQQLQSPPQTTRLEFQPSLQSQPQLAFRQPAPQVAKELPVTPAQSGNLTQLPSLHFSHQVSLLPSPSESLSSIFSAYSHSSDGSDYGAEVRLSDGTSTSITSPPYKEAPTFSQYPEEVSTPQPTVHSFKTVVAAEPIVIANQATEFVQRNKSLPRKPLSDAVLPASPPPPPPPSKEESSHPASAPVQIPRVTPRLPLAGKSEFLPDSPPPSRSQLWRRRSLKGSRELPDLKLDYSHGSTAASQQLQPRPTLAPAKSTENQIMGQGIAKLKQLKDLKNLKNKFHFSRRSDDSSPDTKEVAEPSRPSLNRPPTPEYQKQDVRTPVRDNFVSPVSPATSPEPHEVSPDLEPEKRGEPYAVPPNSMGEKKPVARKAIPTPVSSLQPVKSLPDLQRRPPQSVLEPMPTVPADRLTDRPHEFVQPPRPSSIHRPASRASYMSEPAQYSDRRSDDMSIRGGYGRPGMMRSGTPTMSNRAPESRMVRSNSGRLCYEGRFGTLYHEMGEFLEPDPKATRFPESRPPLPEGMVVQARPLRGSHYTCYKNHRHMQRRMNKRHPLSCQTCEKSDTEDRWHCTFCHLRVCESCWRGLESKGRDLNHLMESLSHGAPLRLSSASRPGSALGLHITTTF